MDPIIFFIFNYIIKKDQFKINQILKDEIEKIYIKKFNQNLLLNDKIEKQNTKKNMSDQGHEPWWSSTSKP